MSTRALEVPDSLISPLLGRAAALPIVETALEWLRRFRAGSGPLLAAATFGGMLLFAVLAPTGYWIVPLAAVPLFLTYHTYKVYMGRIEDEQDQVKQTAELHLATIEALARAIDAKEQLSHNHVWRVQHYAARLAGALGLTDVEIHGIKTAALLHDIGKLAVPEHVLSKAGPLTNEEFDKVRIHPQIGAEIIAGVPFPYPVAATMLCHHERWDGSGYPHQLKGEAIPLGARILSVVDYFDSVTSARPYHPPMGQVEATELIRREAGAALDPQLVTAFIALLPELLRESAAREELTANGSRFDSRLSRSVSDGQAAERCENVFENIALAHREVYALYEIAQSMSTSLGVADTMALISSKLTTIVPWSGCSLFLYDRALDALTFRFSAGLDAGPLLDRTMPNGSALAEWVAGRRRTLVNAEPQVAAHTGDADRRTEPKSAMLCPLYFADAFVGVFSVYHVDPQHYNEDHRRLFERVAEQTGTALHNSLVFERTQQEALTDQLTSLPNRRWLFRYLPQELSRADRPATEVAVISIDIDDFKIINDTYGHEVGDRALCAMADTLQAVCRLYDVCARHAGDEFVVVLPDCSRENADIRRRELQRRLDEIEIEVAPGVRWRLGASAGVAVFPHDGHTRDELLEVADRNMYCDKASRSGRTRQRADLPLEEAGLAPATITDATLSDLSAETMGRMETSVS